MSIDGNPATLLDLSIVGAMVVSPTILRPNQRVRMSLPDESRPVRFSAGVAWASFEMPKGGPRYRAGIEFFDADPVARQPVHRVEQEVGTPTPNAQLELLQLPTQADLQPPHDSNALPA